MTLDEAIAKAKADGDVQLAEWLRQARGADAAVTLGDVPRLPHFWTHDGTLHVEATRMPTRIVVCEGGTCEFVPKRELDASEAENAKLRELVKDMWPHVRHRSRMCGECELSCDTSDECLLYEPMRQRMRELGVEVEP